MKLHFTKTRSIKEEVKQINERATNQMNSLKENPLDFTLWKKTTEGINWDSPWSKGRPGWHTECVVMIDKKELNKYLKEVRQHLICTKKEKQQME